MSELVIPSRVVRAIVAHAYNPSPARWGRETVGRIVARGDYAVRYEPLRNVGRGDQRFMVRHGWDDGLRLGESAWLVHSHPDGKAVPSRADLRGASPRLRENPYGIVSIYESGVYDLKFFDLIDRKNYVELDAVVV